MLEGVEGRCFDGSVEIEILLHAADGSSLIAGDEADDGPGGAGSCRTSGAMQVVLVVGWRIEVDDRRHRVDVNPASGDVRRDQRLGPIGCERLERAVALVLRSAPVHGDGVHAELRELLGESVRSVAGPREDDRAVGGLDQVGGVFDPVVVLHQPEMVLRVDGLRHPRLPAS